MRVFGFLALIILLATLGLGIYIMWQAIEMQSVEYKSFSANLSGSKSAEGSNLSKGGGQFYPDMRFRDREISYRLESVCGVNRWNDVRRAFDILSEKTLLRFYATNNTPDIVILCSDVAPEPKQKGHFIAGEGGPSEVVDAGRYWVILEGKVSLYKEERCDEPEIALHEILHALGFDHSANFESIMYPVTECDKTIDGNILSELNRLYAQPSASDLAIEKITANKTGVYLNFEATVSNIGLKDSGNASLIIYSSNREAANFSLGTIEIGAKRILKVENARVGSDLDKIVFLVKPAEGEEEITLVNNAVELFVSGKDNI